MKDITLQRRPLYSIGTVSRLTGIKADTLRVWERRYDLGASHKSASGRRLFTQSDLEHLQLIAALVAGGIRIGDIARSERRTLEAMLASQANTPRGGAAERKPRVLFVGNALCDWLEEHQGILSAVNAFLLPAPLDQIPGDLLDTTGELHGAVVEVGGLGETSTRQLASLCDRLGSGNILALYRFGSQRWLGELEQLGFAATPYPPEPQFLANYLKVSVALRDAREGQESIGSLAEVKPRLFDEAGLADISRLKRSVECECPKHLVSLVRALADFEAYSASCSVESWRDASLHACVYAYTGQARWLMEKALTLMVEAHYLEGERGTEASEIEGETVSEVAR